ncbi:hypothetical protein AGABI2DRAFT_224564 [Agaricus bisporus var. bisporus H97]|uniref:hypothetical protein n=1 Tax=Agaricus bisporus var. bisporus (strain H97 / ATCC MYA-4626 / FGSC 10389) TaxID=936046 RepID=UPI00029F5307|nr:hypothetical protein AGABI2DRAFT_224564 [Agaricus bisporus var. bisporus H97]EKV46089.1 hypothetical protein AGABI2DRAFT_224564 [Agaricus bisporus var. bisporus H97]
MPAVRHSIDLKANGEVSRMRHHKGNMPSLPQTKFCSLCPAKFTRTTHLNRHLRSHTNERLHRCNTCNAEFTRSDLLTRHKRTCGDSRNANRSRRKSCQACAESKVKCNLQYPCSKCSSRGRECVFINDPEASRNKRNAAKRAMQQAAAAKAAGDPTMSETPSSMSSKSSPPYTSLLMHTPSPTLSLDSQLLSLAPFELPGLSTSSSSSIASSGSSPRSDLLEPRGDFAPSFQVSAFDTLSLDNQLNRLFPNSTSCFDNFGIQSSFSPPSGPFQELSTWLDGGEQLQKYGDNDMISYAHASHEIKVEGQDNLQEYGPPGLPFSLNTIINPVGGLSDPSALSSAPEPTPEELEHYLYLFFSAFGTQIPLVHPSTWKPEGKPPVLIRAMQACGALFVKTKTATNFVNDTLAETRDVLIAEFTNSGSDLSQQVNIIIAVVLLQTIALYYQRPEQRSFSNTYHAILVTMIRRIRLIDRVSAWSPPDLTDVSGLDKAWKSWAQYETIKRALFVSYLHDCCHCLYFSLPPSFQPSELDINLPCDDGIWAAGSAAQWLQAIKSPSQYGVGMARLSGFSMQRALATLSGAQSPATLPALNPFAHFILIHTIIRDLYVSSARDRPDGSPTDTTRDSGITTSTQRALQTWTQMWVNSPDATRYDNNREEAPFVYNALPFFWLAQVSLMVLQEDSGVDTKLIEPQNEAGFRFLKEWLARLRYHLRNGTQIPPQLWDELMKIRTQLQLQQADRSNCEQACGLVDIYQKS